MDLGQASPAVRGCPGSGLLRRAAWQQDRGSRCTDPPYNVPINGHVSGNGCVRHREFAMASGEMSAPEFTQFLSTTLGLAVNASRDGALHYVCMDWRHLFELFSAGRPLYGGLLNLCVWNKDNGGMGSFYRSKHELVAVFKVGSVPHINNVKVGRHGRSPSIH